MHFQDNPEGACGLARGTSKHPIMFTSGQMTSIQTKLKPSKQRGCTSAPPLLQLCIGNMKEACFEFMKCMPVNKISFDDACSHVLVGVNDHYMRVLSESLPGPLVERSFVSLEILLMDCAEIFAEKPDSSVY